MKKLLFTALLFLPTILFSQTLKEFDLQEMSEQQIPVFIDHPNEGAIIFYTAINGLTVESSTGGVVSTQSEGSKFTAFLKPERQILTLKAPGFLEKKLPVENFSAKQAKFYRLNGKEESYSSEKGSYMVRTEPDGCLLTIDGISSFKQFTPFELKDFESKKYRIFLKNPDFMTLDTLIEIRPGLRQSGLFRLRSKFANLSLSAPAMVSVRISNRTLEVGPEFVTLQLKEGNYVITVNDPRFEPYREVVEFKTGETRVINLNLVKKTGFLKINHPDFFEVVVDGISNSKKVGVQLLELTEGKHEALITRAGFKPLEYDFTITRGNVLTWSPEFELDLVKVSINTFPEGASVTLFQNNESKPLGFTPLEEMLPIGEAEFTIKKTGFENYRFTTVIEGEKPFSRTIDLNNPEGKKETKAESVEIFKSIEMVYIDGGNFLMGDTFGDGESGEKPLRQVLIGNYYIGSYEVTQIEWEGVMGSNPSKFKGKRNPVENISWLDAIDFCNKLSKNEGLSPVFKIKGNMVYADFLANGYRLPTEAEWEFAARGGIKTKSTKFAGTNILTKTGWYYGNSGNSTHPVGDKQPNELGLFDMSGNVWEWCMDWKGVYQLKQDVNPTGLATGSYRVLRGGSWKDFENTCRVSRRDGNAPTYTNDSVGFRICRLAESN